MQPPPDGRPRLESLSPQRRTSASSFQFDANENIDVQSLKGLRFSGDQSENNFLTDSRRSFGAPPPPIQDNGNFLTDSRRSHGSAAQEDNTGPSIRGRRNKNIWSQILMKFDQNFGFEDEIFVKFWF